eukprot:PLAT3099.1.p1 GENE.PLAT3099.1~~PLAT3099.1.p1  ORF type:complete len:574 (-),score=160.51 PLAT3099.1:77-1798(-)
MASVTKSRFGGLKERGDRFLRPFFFFLADGEERGERAPGASYGPLPCLLPRLRFARGDLLLFAAALLAAGAAAAGAASSFSADAAIRSGFGHNEKMAEGDKRAAVRLLRQISADRKAGFITGEEVGELKEMMLEDGGMEHAWATLKRLRAEGEEIKTRVLEDIEAKRAAGMDPWGREAEGGDGDSKGDEPDGAAAILDSGELPERYVSGVESDVPRFIIDLDDEPEERWTEVVEAFKDQLQVAAELVSELVGTGWVARMATGFMSRLVKWGAVMFHRELSGIAALADVPVGKLALLQIAYEAFAFCTSVVVDGPDGFPLHIRTMDWDMEELKALTIEVEFRQRDRPLFTATSWAGYVGVLTGMRHGAYALSINYRRTGRDPLKGLLTNLWRGAKADWPTGFLNRVVLEEDATYDAAVASLAASSLMAPVYIIVSGTRAGEGVVLSRNRSDEDQRWTLAEDGAIVQPNMDAWSEAADEDICSSLFRRALVRACLDTILPEEMTAQLLWSIMRLPVVLADDNVYTVFMSAAISVYTSQVRPTGVREASARWQPVVARVVDQFRRDGGQGSAVRRR